MNLVFSQKAWDQFCALADQDPKLQKKIRTLIKECLTSPFSGRHPMPPLPGWGVPGFHHPLMSVGV
jgi:Txe/YoeB family toxin of Txe-Axe toxin-antitoxin module